MGRDLNPNYKPEKSTKEEQTQLTNVERQHLIERYKMLVKEDLMGEFISQTQRIIDSWDRVGLDHNDPIVREACHEFACKLSRHLLDAKFGIGDFQE